jgi:alpha-ketoglutarate-dependent taurine dioxygenase
VKSLVQVTASGAADWWGQEQDGIRAVLAEHFGAELAGSELPESPDPAALRARLRAVAPRLCALTDRVRAEFDDGACAVLVPRVGVAGVEVDQQRVALYTLASVLGDVIANHPETAAVWDVRDRGRVSPNHQSHSESSAAAGYHTDAGYLRIPPRFFLLYAAKAAACGGGASLIRDGRMLKNQLADTEKGRAAIEALSQVLPRRVPKQYDYVAFLEQDGWQYSRILGDKPMWRWGKKNTSIAVRANPEYSTPQVWEAIATVSALLKNGPGEFRPALPTDGVLIIDNHIALHGRTEFQDSSRHLFRIRFHDPADPER